MKVLVRKLTGTALDWAVAKCEGSDSVPAYSTDWVQGAPLLERAKFELFWNVEAAWWSVAGWDARAQCEVVMRDESLLVAICRCHVACSVGDEIEIPEDLL